MFAKIISRSHLWNPGGNHFTAVPNIFHCDVLRFVLIQLCDHPGFQTATTVLQTANLNAIATIVSCFDRVIAYRAKTIGLRG